MFQLFWGFVLDKSDLKHKLLRLLLVGGLAVATDQLTKAWAVATLQHSCETLSREGAAAPTLQRCHPRDLTVDLGAEPARELRFQRTSTPFFTLECKGGAACLRGPVKLGESRDDALASRVARDPVDQAMVMLRGVPIDADHLTTGADGQLYRVIVVGADGRESGLRFRYRSPAKGIDVVNGWFRLRYVENPGAAWGLLGSLDEGVREPLFIVISLVAAAFLVWVYARTHQAQVLLGVALALILGGAVGNFIDRLHLGRVVDFIELHYQDKLRWPTFNVADVAISVGVVMLFIDGARTFLRDRRHRQAQPPAPAPPTETPT